MAMLPPDPKYLLRGDMGCVHSLLFRNNPFIEHLYAGTTNGKVHIWDLQRNRELMQLTGKKDPCLSLNIVNDSTLITQHKCGIINIFEASASQWILNKSTEVDYCSFCRFQILSEDIILIPQKDSGIGLFSLKTHSVIAELDPSKLSDSAQFGEVMAIKPILNTEEYVLAAYDGGYLILWDLKKREALNTLTVKTIEPCPMALDYDTSLMKGIIGGSSDKLQIFEITKKQEMLNKSTVTIKNSGTSVLKIRGDSKIFVAGGWDGRLRIFSCKTSRQLATLDQHKDTIHDVIYSSSKIEAYNTRYLMAAAGKDGYVSLWDIYN